MSEKSISKVANDFLRFEVENNLFSVIIKNHRFWEYLRYDIFNEIANKILDFNLIDTAYNKQKAYHEYPKRFFLYLINRILNFKKKGKYDIILLNDSRTAIIEGKNVNIYTYPVANVLNDKYETLIVDQDFAVNKFYYPCEVIIEPPSHFFNRIRSTFVTFDYTEKSMLIEIGKNLKRKFDVDLDIYSMSKHIYAKKIGYRKKVFTNIFEKYRPAIFVYTDDGSMQGIIEAAHEFGVTTIEFQHSLVSDQNIQYNYLSNTLRYSTIPDYIFSFGDFWNDIFRLPAKAVSVGFPYFDMMRQRHKSTNTTNRLKNIIICSVLISKDIMAKFAADLAELLPDYNIYYKLRPVEYERWEQRYPDEFKEKNNIIVIDNDRIPLYEYFYSCGYQIGVNSTTLYEGLGFGLITFIIRTGWYGEMKPLFANDYVFLASNADDVAKKLKSTAQPRNRLEVESIFKRHSVENIEKEIQRIIEISHGKEKMI